ncbi:MAG: hypothetical protein AB7O48_11095 [Cyclobacteriaceae bacterium]
MKKNTITVLILIFTVTSLSAQVKIKEISGMGQKKFKDAAKKVYISDFRVNYQLLYSQTEVAEGGREIGGGYRGDAKAGLTMGVKGLEQGDLMEITNHIYQKYAQEFQSMGFAIVSASDASKIEEFEGYELKEGGTISEDQFPGLLSTTPGNYQYLIKKTTAKGKEKGRFNGYKASAQLGGAIVASLNIDVLFVEDAESGASKALGKAVGGVAKIVVRPNLRIAEARSNNQFFFAEKEIKPLAYTKMEVKDPVEIAGVFEDKKYKAAESAQTDNWGSQVGTMRYFNVSDSYLSKTIPLECDASKYKSGVKEAAGAYVDTIFATFKDY